jgi:hypothetical protein
MITSGQLTVGTLTPSAIDGASVNPILLTVHNNDSTKSMFLGGSDVSTTTGLKLLKQESYQFTINPGEVLYAISADGGHVISWIAQTL